MMHDLVVLPAVPESVVGFATVMETIIGSPSVL